MVKKTIMIVDDETDILKTTKTLLELNNFDVITAINADDALKKLKKKTPDLILLDIMMPGTPVKEVVPKLKDTKIAYFSVIKTTDSEKESLLKTKNVVGFIQKPFDIDDLLKKVKNWLNKK